jgi:hypothetical protein
VTAVAQGDPSGLESALAGTLSSLVGNAADIPNPDAVTGDVQSVVTKLLAGNQAGAVSSLSDLIEQLVGATGVVPAGVTLGVQYAVDGLLGGNPTAALNGLGYAVSAAVAGLPTTDDGSQGGSLATYDLLGSTGTVGSAVGPVLGGTGLFAPGRLLFAVSQTRSAVSGGPRLVVEGARIVTHKTRVRVKVVCLGSSSQTCSGIVRIRQLNKVIAQSSTLKLVGGKTEKVLLKVKGTKSAKKTAKKTAKKASKKA